MSKQQSQEYRGNGQHAWETVVENNASFTSRLRVPGGWLYRCRYALDGVLGVNIVFVPMPEVVVHKV
jgi:hypothetical protein